MIWTNRADLTRSSWSIILIGKMLNLMKKFFFQSVLRSKFNDNYKNDGISKLGSESLGSDMNNTALNILPSEISTEWTTMSHQSTVSAHSAPFIYWVKLEWYWFGRTKFNIRLIRRNFFRCSHLWLFMICNNYEFVTITNYNCLFFSSRISVLSLSCGSVWVISIHGAVRCSY